MLIPLAALVACLPALATAQDVFAHIVMGSTGAYSADDWTTNIKLAQSYGIDAFALNIAYPYNDAIVTQTQYAFQAADALAGTLSTDFKLFFSFDYLGGGQPWPDSDVINVLNTWIGDASYFQVYGKPFVSTFEGPSNSDWTGIRSSITNLYFVPDWTSLGPSSSSFNLDLVDGAFSWDMWPDGPMNITTDSDNAWDADFTKPAGKSYMMGVSPWFYTDLPGDPYDKAWIWRGDDMWSRRWDQTLEILPDFVEIVTWNDFGESHYVGPIVDSGIPSGDGYTEGYPHTAWLETLPYQIAAYKNAYNSANAAPSVEAGAEKIVFWYRTSPAGAGSTDVAANNCVTSSNPNGNPQETCSTVTAMLEDAVFAIVLASTATTATMTIGGVSQDFNVNAGINGISMPFNGNTGTVSVSMGSVTGSGVDITAEPSGGVANFNAWVGCAGSCA